MTAKKPRVCTLTFTRKELELLTSKLDDGNSPLETDLLLELEEVLGGISVLIHNNLPAAGWAFTTAIWAIVDGVRNV